MKTNLNLIMKCRYILLEVSTPEDSEHIFKFGKISVDTWIKESTPMDNKLSGIKVSTHALKSVDT